MHHKPCWASKIVEGAHPHILEEAAAARHVSTCDGKDFSGPKAAVYYRDELTRLADNKHVEI